MDITLLAAVSGFHPFVVSPWGSDVLIAPITPESLESSLERALGRMEQKPSWKGPEAQARFRYLDESGTEQWATFVSPKFTIGRSSSNNLVIAKMNISRTHAEVVMEDGECVLYDLGSKHGTFVNGNKIEGTTVLNENDLITMGKTILVLKVLQ